MWIFQKSMLLKMSKLWWKIDYINCIVPTAIESQNKKMEYFNLLYETLKVQPNNTFNSNWLRFDPAWINAFKSNKFTYKIYTLVQLI